MPITAPNPDYQLAQLRSMAEVAEWIDRSEIGPRRAAVAADRIVESLSAISTTSGYGMGLAYLRRVADAQPDIADAVWVAAPDFWFDLQTIGAECPYPAYYDPSYYDGDDLSPSFM